MTEKIIVRTATGADAALLASVGRRSFEAAFGADNTPEDMADYLNNSFSEEIQARELAQAGSLFLIAETENGEPVGYARLLAGCSETCITGQRPVELVRFYMLPEWIGKGTSALLMQAALEAARGRGYDVAWLGVWQKNPRAIKFYEKWGFTIVGAHSFLLGSDLQTDWIMEQKLG